MELVNTPTHKVDVRYELEYNIIALLLLHGQEEVEINDVVVDTESKDELSFKTTSLHVKVYEKVYLDLQQDEVELSTPAFRKLYEELLVKYNTQQPLIIDAFIRDLTPEQSELVTNIMMQDESKPLHDWARKNIFVKEKTKEIGRWLTQTILNFRCHLIQEKIGSLQQQTTDLHQQTHNEVLEEVQAYVGLRKNLSERLDRVLF
jgi:DNA primase